MQHQSARCIIKLVDSVEDYFIYILKLYIVILKWKKLNFMFEFHLQLESFQYNFVTFSQVGNGTFIS